MRPAAEGGGPHPGEKVWRDAVVKMIIVEMEYSKLVCSCLNERSITK